MNKHLALIVLFLVLVSFGCTANKRGITFEPYRDNPTNRSDAHRACVGEIKGSPIFRAVTMLSESGDLGFDDYLHCMERYGWTPVPKLHEAASDDNVSEIKSLLDNGADVNQRSYAGVTPLYYAALYENISAIEVLLKYEADINAIYPGNGFTPLHIAVDYDEVESVKTLLAHGANVNVKSKDGRTPIDIAIKNGYTAIEGLLRNNGGLNGFDSLLINQTTVDNKSSTTDDSERISCKIDYYSMIKYEKNKLKRYAISPDRKHVAYMASADNKWFVVVDGKEGKQYDDMISVNFSPDSQHDAYIAKERNKWFVVVDGKEGKQYDDMISVNFSPDSQHVAYEAKEGEKWFVVVDSKEG